MKTLYIVRHGDTFPSGSDPLRIGAATDIPLTARGEAQALALGRWFTQRNVNLAAAVSGPLRRTTRTAQLILSELPTPPPSLGTAAWLHEIDHGPDEGRPERQVVERVGRVALDKWDRIADPPAGWRVDRAARIMECRRGIDALGRGATLLVTSNGAARFILLALDLAHTLPTLRLRTGAVGEVTIAGEERRLIRWDVRPTEL